MATKSIGLTGRDYSTLAAWCSYVNALSLSAPEIGEVYNDGEIVDTAPCTLSGYTGSSGSNQVILRPAAGHGFKDHASAATNPLGYDASKGAALKSTLGSSASGCYRFDGGNIVVDGLQFKNTVDTALTCRMSLVAGSTLKNSILDANSGYGALKMDSVDALFENLAVVQRFSGGYGIYLASTGTMTPGVVRGCTVINVAGSSTASGLNANTGTPRVINTAVYGFASSFDGGSAYHASDCTNNATSQSSFSAANCNPNGQVSITSADFVSVTSGAPDLRPASGSTKLINTGATSGLGIDIFGTTRPQGASYDIGAVEYAAGDTTAPTLTSPTGAQTGSTTATVGATTDEGNGTMYAVVTVSGTPPSVTQIQAGQDSAGAAATYAGSQSISSTGPKSFSATGLSASTAYYAHIQHKDAAANNSTVVSSAQFTTAAGGGSTAKGANVARRNQSGVNSFGLRR